MASFEVKKANVYNILVINFYMQSWKPQQGDWLKINHVFMQNQASLNLIGLGNFDNQVLICNFLLNYLQNCKQISNLYSKYSLVIKCTNEVCNFFKVFIASEL